MNTCATICLCQLITLAIFISVAVTIPLTVKTTLPGPRFFIKEFYVPALDLSQLYTTRPNNNNNNNNNNNTIVIFNPCLFFDIAFVNIEDDHRVHYGDVNLTFSYHGGSNKAVANYVVRSFDQGWLDVDYRREVVESPGVPWEDAVKAVSNGSAVVFRVDLAARIEFDLFNSKKKDVKIGADVEVDGTGLKLKREDIRLDSAASRRWVLGNILVLFLSLLVTWQCFFF